LDDEETHMDWMTVLSATGFSAAAAGTVAMILKRSFEALLQTSIAKVQEENRVAIAEVTRRKAAVFDQQSVSLKSAAAFAYRSRNTARTIKEAICVGHPPVDGCALRDLHGQHLAMRELLYHEVAILPPEIFTLVHRQGHLVQTFFTVAEMASSAAAGSTKEHMKREAVKTAFLALDEGYQSIVAWVRDHLGVTDD
jgi:hypothetical protein